MTVQQRQSDFSLSKEVLMCQPLESNHTAEYLAKTVENYFGEMGLLIDQVLAIVRDDAKNMIALCDCLKIES